MAKKNDNLVAQLLKKVEEKKEQIKKIKNPDFTTNLSFPILESNTRLNLNAVDEDVLFYLLVKIDTMKSAAVIAKKEDIVYDELWGSFKLDEWYNDIVLKIKQRQAQRQVAELKTIENKLKGLMSEDKRTNMELESLSKLLEG